MEKINESAPSVPENFPRPLWQGVVLKRCKLTIESKLILSENVKTGVNEAWVMAVGHETKGNIQVGMRVVYNNVGNTFLIHNDIEYHCCHENDVYAKIVEKDGIEVPVPFNKFVLLERGQGAHKIAGVYLPDNQTLINYGVIVGVGEKALKDIQPGQKVMFNYSCDYNFKFRRKTLYWMCDFDILAILPHDTYIGVERVDRQRRADIPLDKLPEKEPEKKVKGTKFHGLDGVGEN